MCIYKKIFKKTFLIIVLLVNFCLFTNVAYSQTIHTIIVAATNIDDAIIQKGVRKSVEKFRKETKQIEQNTNLTIKEYYVTGVGFNSDNLRNTIDNIYCNNQDVIFFYFNGHGFRYIDQNEKWPILSVGYDINTKSEIYKHGVHLNEIINKLKAKGSRLEIIIADCCNSDNLNLSVVDEEIKGLAELSFNIRLPQRFSELYENSSGSIIASSSIPGQASRISSRLGGFFTSSFLEIHKELTSISNSASWNTLFEKAKKRTHRIAEINGKNQLPQFEINITQNTNTHRNIPWNNYISSNRGAFNSSPNNFSYNDPYNNYKFPVARIVMFSNNRVFFLMSDNFIVEHSPYKRGLMLTGYRAFSQQPQRFQWDIVNPINPFNTLIYGVDYYGLIWTWNNFGRRWENVGVVYY